MSIHANQTEAHNFQSLSVEDLFKKLAASPKGLSAEEASNRLKDHGYNEIKRTNEIKTAIPLLDATDRSRKGFRLTEKQEIFFRCKQIFPFYMFPR